MRVIGGSLRSRRLVGPKGLALRPTPDRVREALFDILGSVEGFAVLDLCAGTGAVAIEALSRGAARAVLVDRDPHLAERNLAALGLAATVHAGDASLIRDRGPFELVFADPPYDDAPRLGASLLEHAATVLAEGGTFVFEHARGYTPPERHRDMTRTRTRLYGDTALSFYARERTSKLEYKTIAKLADRLDGVKPSATLALSQKARELAQSGQDVVSLTAGEPDFQPAPHIIEATKAALDAGYTRYTNVGGIDELKAAIREVYVQTDALRYELNEIVVSAGAKQAVYNAVQAIVDPGDEVILVAPYWLSYRDIVCLAGGVPVVLDTTEDDAFLLRPEALARAISPRTKALILNSPSNPTGATYRAEDLEGLAAVLEAHPRVFIIADEIYRRFAYGGREAKGLLSVAKGLMDRCLVIDGCSKTYSMTGLRIGWAVGPRNVISAMQRIQGQSTSNPATPMQYAALAALTGDQSWVDEMVDTFDTRRRYVVGRLNALPGVSCFDPAGAFYAFPKVSGLFGRALPDGMELKDAAGFAAYLLHEHHLVLVPGGPFGSDAHVRLSFATDLDTLARGLDRLDQAIRALK